ncbi:MAG: hypothetical protein ACE147_12970 [Candidatus Methylomirabilales bacterium]
MTTIVLYRDGDAPVNEYPERIVSPTRPRACCPAFTAPVGRPWVEGRARLQYARCARCGFTVRRVLAAAPDPAVLRAVQEAFRPLFGDRSQARARLGPEDARLAAVPHAGGERDTVAAAPGPPGPAPARALGPPPPEDSIPGSEGSHDGQPGS